MSKQNSKVRKLGIKISVTVLAILLFSGIYYIRSLNKPLDKMDQNITSIQIPSGASTEKIGNILEENGLIASGYKFKLLSKLEGNDGRYKAGEYNFSPSMSSKEIMNIIILGKSNTKKITIPEGFTIKQIANRLEAENIVNQSEFWKEVSEGKFEYKFMNMLPEGKKRLEGFLYPETYFVYSNESAHNVLDKMLGQFDKLVTEEYYQRAEELGYSIYEIVIIASLIERETMASEEGPLVASVIYNRLAINQPLGIDATIQYALPEHKKKLSIADTKVDSPYNTYRNAGLPPGPICSPGIEAIKAALYPANTDYYYYVLSPDKDGKHRFSNSYEEFLKNKKAYKDSL